MHLRFAGQSVQAPICWLTLHMPSMVRAWGAQCKSPMWLAGTEPLSGWCWLPPGAHVSRKPEARVGARSETQTSYRDSNQLQQLSYPLLPPPALSLFPETSLRKPSCSLPSCPSRSCVLCLPRQSHPTVFIPHHTETLLDPTILPEGQWVLLVLQLMSFSCIKFLYVFADNFLLCLLSALFLETLTIQSCISLSDLDYSFPLSYCFSLFLTFFCVLVKL